MLLFFPFQVHVNTCYIYNLHYWGSVDTGCGEHSNIQVVRRRKFQEDENDRRDWLLWVTDPLGSALQILWRNWSTPIPLGAATARGKFCEKPQKVLGSFEVCAADLMQELEHTYPLVGKRVRQLRKGSSARNGRKSSGSFEVCAADLLLELEHPQTPW